MSSNSLHLTARDFDAYLPEKATSKAYSRPRLEVKQRALAWGRRILERLSVLGIQADIHASDEHPSHRNKNHIDCQWLFFWRDEKARAELDRLLQQGRSISEEIDDPSPYTRHAFLALRLDSKTVEVCFAVHPAAKVDVDNLKARLSAGAREGAETGPSPLAAEFTRALKALPEQFMIGVHESDRTACSTATPEAITDMLEHAAAGQTPLWIGWSIPRETALEHADILDEQLEDALAALAPIYKLVAWSRENDHVALDQRISGLEEERARAHAETTAQFERWQAEQEAQRERSRQLAQARSAEESPRYVKPRPPLGHSPPFGAPGGRRPSLDTLFKAPGKEEQRAPHTPANKGEHAELEAAPKRPAKEPPAPPHERKPTAEPRQNSGAHTPAQSAPAASNALEKGARVRVKSGAFADKIGAISELDGRGGARVLLGLLSTRLELSELEPAPEERQRPALQSSHRKPVPPPPRKSR